MSSQQHSHNDISLQIWYKRFKVALHEHRLRCLYGEMILPAPPLFFLLSLFVLAWAALLFNPSYCFSPWPLVSCYFIVQGYWVIVAHNYLDLIRDSLFLFFLSPQSCAMRRRIRESEKPSSAHWLNPPRLIYISAFRILCQCGWGGRGHSSICHWLSADKTLTESRYRTVPELVCPLLEA